LAFGGAVNKTSILIIDDHSLLRSGLKLLLGGQPDLAVVGEAGDGPTAVQLASVSKPDVILLDITLPGKSGLEVLPALRQSSPKSRIIALTMHEDEGYLRSALSAGVVGYVPKRAADSELVTAIRAVVRGEVYIHSSVTRTLVEDLAPAPNGVANNGNGTWQSLSERERAVLIRVAGGHTNVEISKEFNLSVKTIETYRARGLEKLGLTNRASLVNFTLAHGLWGH